jgi:rhamnose utilization protein RhaD (predicted bifunctional aldolase and dehydrogenase)
VLAITNTGDGERRIAEIYGDTVVVVPYVMPGFDLARVCAELFPRHAGANTIGMVLMRHGIFSFGATAQESYERMIELVTLAEDYLKRNGAWDFSSETDGRYKPGNTVELARLRKEISAVAGFPVVFETAPSSPFLEFAARPDIKTISQKGPATPDHVIRTKRVPMVGRDAERARQRAVRSERRWSHADSVRETAVRMRADSPRRRSRCCRCRG